MAQQQQFSYSPVTSGINTKPVLQSSSPGVYLNNKSKAASDIEDIMNAALSVGKAYNTYQQEQNKISKDEASMKLLNLKLEAQSKLNETNENDINGYTNINNWYKTQSQTILDNSDLTDEHRNALTMSVMETSGTIDVTTNNLIKKASKKQALEGTAAAVAMLNNNPIDDNTKVVFTGLKQTLLDNGHTEVEAEEYLTQQYLSTKLATINKDTTSVAEMNRLLTESDSFIKELISPNMINKEAHTKFKNGISTIKDGLSKEEVFTLNQYAENDATSLKVFKDMVSQSKASGALDDITAANLIQKKNDRIETNYIKAQAKKDIIENKVKQEGYRNLQALMTNSLIDDNDKNKAIQEAVDKGIISSEVAGNLAADVIVDNMKEQKQKDIERNKAIMLEKEQWLENAKATMTTTLKDSETKPEEFSQLVIQTSLGKGNPVTANEQKLIADYTVQYKLENDVFNTKKLYETFDTDWSNIPGKDGYKKAVSNLIDKEYNNQNFNPKAIIELNKRHKVSGNIEASVIKETSNATTAISAIAKFNVLDNYDSNAAKDLYGDKTYAFLKGLSNMTTVDKDKNTIIPPDALNKLKDVKSNPEKYPVDMKEFTEQIKDNLDLYNEKETYKTYVRFGMDADEALTKIKENVAKYKPVEGVYLKGYTRPVSPNDNRYMEMNVFDIQQSNSNMIGFAYNPQDKSFYFSSKEDMYYSKIENKDVNGNKMPITTLEDLNSLFENKRKNKVNTSIIGKTLNKIDDKVDFVNIPTQQEVKAFTNQMKQ